MSFLLKWLKPETSHKISLRPRQDVTLEIAYDDAYANTKTAIEQTLGANVTIDDKSTHLIEASFGLVNSERIRCTFDCKTESTTTIRIEALFPAGANIPKESRAVEALAEALKNNR